MMGKEKYKVAVWVLAVTVIIEGVFIFSLLSRKPPKKVVVQPAAGVKGRIAIVLDDWGYNLKNLSAVESIKFPLTLSVLPGLAYSKKISEELHKMGFEIILHLPMEPREKYRLEKNTLMSDMEEKKVLEILDKDLSDVPHLKGVSNHMGSKATESARLMSLIFKELKDRRLYFLDSLVSGASVCSEAAREAGIGFIKRDVFLDNLQDAGYISNQLEKLKSKARSRGFAVGIGHDRKVTLEVLKEKMPSIEKEGYKFVFVSELIG